MPHDRVQQVASIHDREPQPLENARERIEMARCAPRGPSMEGSKKIGVKKMPNMSTTCTMYFTSRKKRFAQLRKSDTPVVNSHEQQEQQRNPRETRVQPYAEKRQDDDSVSRPIDVSKPCAPTEESGSTSRGK